MTLEDRLRAAVRAEAGAVEPDDDRSLSMIASRTRSARNRRRVLAGGGLAVLVLAAAVLIVPRLGDDDATVNIADDGTTTTTTATDSSTTMSPPTTVETEVNPQILWPGPGVGPFADPVEVVRSFVTDYLGFPDPPLSEFRDGEPGAGEVEVHATGEGGAALDRVASVVSVRQFDGAWYVTAAQSEELIIENPESLGTVGDPVVIDGRGRGFEGTIVLQVRVAFVPAQHVEEVTIAGCCDELLPFHAELPLFGQEPLHASNGAVVAMNTSGLEDAVTSFTVIPVQFQSADTMTVTVFFGSEGPELIPVTRLVPRSSGVLRASLTALLAGPTVPDVEGIRSPFNGDTAGHLDDVTITGERAVVELDGRLADLVSSSDAAEAIHEMNATVFQFENVREVEYRLDGSCDAFASWSDRGCEFFPGD